MKCTKNVCYCGTGGACRHHPYNIELERKRRERMEFKNVLPHAINISGTMNGGYLMEVGCSRFAYGDPDDMLELLKAYLDDPEGMVKKYNEAMNKYGGGGSPSALAPISQDHECDTQEGQTAEEPGGIE